LHCPYREIKLENGVGALLDSLMNLLADEKKPQPILYAHNIDMPTPLQTTKVVSMNNVVSHIKHLPGGRHKGIVSPTVYIGSEGATFNIHREDCAFEGINRHVAGAPKVW
jgi:hypothetical protein